MGKSQRAAISQLIRRSPLAGISTGDGMNLLHQAGWYRPEDERTGLLLGTFLIPVLVDDSLETG